jgi:cytidylate kinase
MGEVMARAMRHWQSRGKTEPAVTEPATPVPATPSLTIAISRQAGANGSAIARALGERLGWPVYDRELIEKIAAEMGLQSQLVQSVDERHSNWLAECLASLTARRGVSQSGYVQHLGRVLLSLAAHGNCVIVGRGAAQILPAATTLRIRLVGPLEQRVAAYRERHGLSVQEAQREVKETDQRRRQFVQDHFHKDPDDATLYDLVLNSSRLGQADCVELIVDALDRLKKASSPVTRPAATAPGGGGAKPPDQPIGRR